MNEIIRGYDVLVSAYSVFRPAYLTSLSIVFSRWTSQIKSRRANPKIFQNICLQVMTAIWRQRIGNLIIHYGLHLLYIKRGKYVFKQNFVSVRGYFRRECMSNLAGVVKICDKRNYMNIIPCVIIQLVEKI